MSNLDPFQVVNAHIAVLCYIWVVLQSGYPTVLQQGEKINVRFNTL